jgi:hypothetical protein
MPKDAKKYRYFTVGLGWDSWILSKLQEDATLHQMDDQPAKLIALRLTEYYKLVESDAIIPGVTARMPQQQPCIPLTPIQVPSMSAGAPMPLNEYSSKDRSGGNVAATGASAPDPESTVAESDNADENADSAWDAFDPDF